MTAFVHPALLWGLGLIAAPILIHLINLWRHRRVRWAAMDFLLESRKKNQRWVLLRQLLLLAARIAAVALVVLMLAQPLVAPRMGAWLGSARTHHVVLLDDSYSMSDRWAETSGFARAREVIARIAEQAAGRGGSQTLTLLRFSRAGKLADGRAADLLSVPLDAGLAGRLRELLASIAPSETAAGPAMALETAGRLLADGPQENRVLYVVSDFRANEWREPGDVRDALAAWQGAQAQIQFVQCVPSLHDNLGIVSLAPQAGTRAAGVPFFIEVAVQNFGRQVARDIAVLLQEDGHARPSLVIDEIAAGAVEARRVLVNFPTAGDHVVTASLENDVVAADNVRHALVTLPLGVGVLVVDGDELSRDGRFLSLALAPGGNVRTGVEPRLETPQFLADSPLDPFAVIYVMNAAQLEPRAVAALEKFAKAGGGVAFFVGPQSDAKAINEQLYRDGQGLFPAPLGTETPLFVDRLERTPDLQVTDHPIFRVFAGERNSFLQTVVIDRYFGLREREDTVLPAETKVLAKLRNGAPLALERKFGAGRVVAFLTTAGPAWNNWGRNPSYVVAMLELQSYLAPAAAADGERQVGAPLVLPIDRARYSADVKFTVPGVDGDTLVAAAANAAGGGQSATLVETPRAGIYEAQLHTTDGQNQVRRFALNVVPAEGNLALVDGRQLKAALPDVPFEFHRADDRVWSAPNLAGFNLSSSLLWLLVVLLVGEQLLAYAASYHPASSGGAR
ncbi:MAG: VWA domain-containing protein [Pirellulales bacterium]|nr:VWA domain-containing protein [Pirellulales bacterium]